MARAQEGARRLVVVARIDPGDDVSLCALLDDGEVVRAAISARHADVALHHAQEHARRGVGVIQVCSIGCTI